MTKKSGDDEIKGIKSTKKTGQVQRTEEVGSVKGVKAASSIGQIGRAGAIGARRPTRTMTLEEREELFQLINEEADKMFANTGLSKEKRSLVESAVKMAVDSGLVDKENSDDGNPAPKTPGTGNRRG